MKAWAFTGHRPSVDYLPSEYRIERLADLLCKLGPQRDDVFLMGGAPGFDVEVFLALKSLSIPDSQLRLCLPVTGFGPQAGSSHKTYNHLAALINSYIIRPYYTAPTDLPSFSAKCMNRNRYMIDCATEGVITNWDGRKSGGTYRTLEMAKKKGLKIINVRGDSSNDN